MIKAAPGLPAKAATQLTSLLARAHALVHSISCGDSQKAYLKVHADQAQSNS